MSTRSFLPKILGLALVVATTDCTAAEWLPHFWKRSCPPTHSERIERAGDPFCVAPWAIGSEGRHDCGYYVGGGAARGGETRYWHEGTWGWDYVPRLTRARLDWYHGRRAQGGEGQYEPDEKNRPLKPQQHR